MSHPWSISYNYGTYVQMFRGAFNQPLNNWDVSNVTNMDGMFDVLSMCHRMLFGTNHNPTNRKDKQYFSYTIIGMCQT